MVTTCEWSDAPSRVTSSTEITDWGRLVASKSGHDRVPLGEVLVGKSTSWERPNRENICESSFPARDVASPLHQSEL